MGGQRGVQKLCMYLYIICITYNWLNMISSSSAIKYIVTFQAPLIALVRHLAKKLNLVVAITYYCQLPSNNQRVHTHTFAAAAAAATLHYTLWLCTLSCVCIYSICSNNIQSIFNCVGYLCEHITLTQKRSKSDIESRLGNAFFFSSLHVAEKLSNIYHLWRLQWYYCNCCDG